MKTITIQTKADKSVIEAIKTLILASDKDAIFRGESFEAHDDGFKEHKSLDEIRAEVKDTIEQIEKGTMKLYTKQEIKDYTDSVINGWYDSLF